jgi:tetratricopeptide (TPR) repeat protein
MTLTPEMSLDTEDRAEELLARGIEHLREGESLNALSCFEKSFSLRKNARCQSYLGAMIAVERGQVKEALTLCEDAISADPEDPVLYLNMGRVFLKAGKKRQAIETVRKGLGFGKSEEAVRFLNSLGTRKRPVIPFLPRRNFVNKYLGLLFKSLGLR